MDNNQSSMYREFRSKDVNRMRNLLMGKSGDKTQTMTGYEKSSQDYNEGDVWTDAFGKNWTIKNGVKQSVTKNDKFKQLAILPMKCPRCENLMKTDDLNKKMYHIHGHCFDCTIKIEQQLKLEGKWHDYEAGKVKANLKTSLEDFEQAVDTWYTQQDSFVSEDGDVENWTQGDKSKIYNEIKTNLEQIKQDNIYK